MWQSPWCACRDLNSLVLPPCNHGMTDSVSCSIGFTALIHWMSFTGFKEAWRAFPLIPARRTMKLGEAEKRTQKSCKWLSVVKSKRHKNELGSPRFLLNVLKGSLCDFGHLIDGISLLGWWLLYPFCSAIVWTWSPSKQETCLDEWIMQNIRKAHLRDYISVPWGHSVHFKWVFS